MKPTPILAFASLLLVGTSATAQTPAAPESYIAYGTCSVCHGEDGIAPNERFPNLAAQSAGYLDATLKKFRDRTRAEPEAQAYMWSIANSLSDETIAEVAAYYAALPPAPASAEARAAEIAEGKDIYDNGVAAANVPACGLCHGPTGEGLGAFPRLSGQHPDYLVRQLQVYRSGEREDPIMNANVANMTDEQMHAVAAYLASL
jgi:cytochrome c553